MKKLFGIFCIILVLFLALPLKIDATTGCWYRIEEENVTFYKQPLDSENQKLFLLEKTYFLYAFSSTNGFLQVSLFDNLNGFVKIVGYVKANQVVQYNGTPVLPYYPTEILTVSQSNAILKAQPHINGEDLGVALNGQNVCFYGKSPQNNGWYYVKYQNEFGYVQSHQLSPLLIAPHPTPIIVPEPEPPIEDAVVEPEPTPNLPQENVNLQVILILLVCIPAVVVVLLLFMPQKNRGRKYTPPLPKYMSENDTFDDLDLM